MQSTFDRRRLNGPEESHPPIFQQEDDDARLIQPGKPRDKRGTADIRPIFLRPGLIDQANGSAYIETENTKIACAVYGPRQSKSVAYSERGRLNVEVKFAPFSCERRKAPMRDAEDRSIAMAIHQALISSVRLELFPKASIDVFISIIESDGVEGCIASCIVAASTALADASIEMSGLVIACSAAVVGKEIWLDPTAKEAESSRGTLVLSCMPALDSITSLQESGQFYMEEVFECMTLCQERCIDIHSVVAQALLENA